MRFYYKRNLIESISPQKSNVPQEIRKLFQDKQMYMRVLIWRALGNLSYLVQLMENKDLYVHVPNLSF